MIAYVTVAITISVGVSLIVGLAALLNYAMGRLATYLYDRRR